MAKKPDKLDTDPTALSPEIRAQIEAYNKQADEINKGTARDQLDRFLKEECKVGPQARAFMLTQEFERPPHRQPRPGDNGTVTRTTKSGEVYDLLQKSYWEERYADIMPQHKPDAGEADVALAAQAVNNMTLQNVLVKKVGIDNAVKLLALAGGELGKVTNKAVPAATGKDVDMSNPWRSGDAPGAHEARLSIIKNNGTKAALALAKAAGTDLAARPLRT